MTNTHTFLVAYMRRHRHNVRQIGTVVLALSAFIVGMEGGGGRFNGDVLRTWMIRNRSLPSAVELSRSTRHVSGIVSMHAPIIPSSKNARVVPGRVVAVHDVMPSDSQPSAHPSAPDVRPSAPARDLRPSTFLVHDHSSASSDGASTHSASRSSERTSAFPHNVQPSTNQSHGESRASLSRVSFAQESFPALQYTVFPVSRVPNWGAMRTPAEWDRSYDEMQPGDFVPVPPYDLSVLTIPMESLIHPILDQNIAIITAKLFYSTRYYGAYDIDAGEFTAIHPSLDLKLARGTPVGAIGGGRVYAVRTNFAMGLYVMIEHRLPDGDTVYSIYGHLDRMQVHEGEDVSPGQIVGVVGMTGNTTGPHLVLEVDRKSDDGEHVPYWPAAMPMRMEAATHTLNPIDFIRTYASGEGV